MTETVLHRRRHPMRVRIAFLVSMVPRSVSRRSGRVAGLALMSLAGCGNTNANANALVGTWTYTTTNTTTPLTTTITLNADGTGTQTLAGTGMPCLGTLTAAGLEWASTDANVTFRGTAACTGTITCNVGGSTVPIACPVPPASFDGAPCAYTLLQGGATLEITNCPNIDRGPVVDWARQ